MGVGGCEIKTIGYTCRSVVRKVFGPGFNSRRLHQTTTAVRLTSSRTAVLFSEKPIDCQVLPYNISLQGGAKANAALISPTSGSRILPKTGGLSGLGKHNQWMEPWSLINAEIWQLPMNPYGYR